MVYLKDAMLSAVQAADAGGATLDLYLVFHLHDPFARSVWHKMLASARSAYVPFADTIFTLIVATDSPAFPHLSPDEARAVLSGLDTLAAECLAATDESEPAGRIGWCYLLDTIDSAGRPLKPLNTDSNSNSITTLQAHMVAEFIALLRAGLRGAPAYQRTSLANIGRAFRGRPASAWISTFAAGSLALPVSAIAERARDALARRLLADHLLGKDTATDLPSARSLRARWLAECALTPTGLRSRIARDQNAQPLSFPIEPPQLGEIPDDRLIDHLLNWDTLLWQRWNRPDGLSAQMALSSEAVLEEADAWISRKIDELVQHEMGGTRIGRLLAAEAEIALEDLRRQLDLPEPSRGPEHWLTALLSHVRSAPSDPAALLDLEASHRQLEAALQHRLNRRALWVRASLIGMTLLSFAWAAYLVTPQALDAGSVLLRRLGVASQLLDLVVLGGLCWLLALSGGWLQLLRSESAIHRALDRVIADIHRKYAALAERALRAECERVLADLRTMLRAQAQAIESRRDTLLETLNLIEGDLNRAAQPAPLLTERSLIAPAAWPSLFPQLDDTACRGLAERFLNVPDREPRRVEAASALAAALRQFVESQLSEWRATLDLDSWAAQPNSMDSLPTLTNHLRDRLRPAWPSDRQERGRIGVAIRRPVAAERWASGPISSIAVNFVGLPSGHEGDPASAGAAGPQDEVFFTDERGRLAFVPTAHALELKALGAWQRLQTAAYSQADEPRATE